MTLMSILERTFLPNCSLKGEMIRKSAYWNNILNEFGRKLPYSNDMSINLVADHRTETTFNWFLSQFVVLKRHFSNF